MNMLRNINQEELFTALVYLNIKELNNLCSRLGLPYKGEKIILIENIKYYLSTGKIPEVKKIPDISKAQPKVLYPLEPNTRILYGSFKNDLKTRMFLKILIGDHFHYTAYGLDWIKNKWFAGEPPTYAEFATYWQQEFLIRKNKKAPLKQEWAYLNFLRAYRSEHPEATNIEVQNAWKEFREKQVNNVISILDSFIKKSI